MSTINPGILSIFNRLCSTRNIQMIILLITSFPLTMVRAESPKITPVDVSRGLTKAVLVENEVDTLDKALRKQVVHMLDTKDFDGLDKMAKDLRGSREQRVTGKWVLDSFYKAFIWDNPQNKEFLTEAEIVSSMNKVDEWVKGRPNSVTARIVLASLWFKYAWLARGTGFAGGVSAEGWTQMKQREGTASNILTGTRKLTESCPRWWYLMLSIAKDEGWEKWRYDALFNECVATYPDYKSAYFARVLNLQPRWHGEAGEWERFAAESADKLGGANGDKFYAQLIWAVDATHWYYTRERYNGKLFADFTISYPRVKKGFEDMLKSRPDSIALLSEFCHLSCAGGDRQRAAISFVQLAGRVDTQVWNSEAAFNTCRDGVFMVNEGNPTSPKSFQ